MISVRLWGALVFTKTFEGYGLASRMAPIARVITCKAAEFMATFQSSPQGGFSATVYVPRVTDDRDEDFRSVERLLEAAWRNVPLEKLDDVIKTERSLRREQERSY